MVKNHSQCDGPKGALAVRFGVLGWGLLAWTVAFALWWGPTACEWWRDYCDILAWRETGGPPYPRRGESFLADLPIKVGIALVVAAIGYVVILALSAYMTIVRRHADSVLGPGRGRPM
jgi:hypothetical protein